MVLIKHKKGTKCGKAKNYVEQITLALLFFIIICIRSAELHKFSHNNTVYRKENIITTRGKKRDNFIFKLILKEQKIIIHIKYFQEKSFVELKS
jgi:hypothetical protein